MLWLIHVCKQLLKTTFPEKLKEATRALSTRRVSTGSSLEERQAPRLGHWIGSSIPRDGERGAGGVPTMPAEATWHVAALHESRQNQVALRQSR